MATNLFNVDATGTPGFAVGVSNAFISTSNSSPGKSSVGKTYSVESKPPTLKPNSNRPINVVRNFPWTYSKPGDSGRFQVPTIVLNEKRLKTNALVSQITSSGGAAIQGIKSIGNYLNKVGIGNNVSTFLSSLEAIVSQTIQEQAAKNPVTGSIVSDIKSLTQDENPRMEDDMLKAYKDLYLTEPTGFSYLMPYFEDYLNSSVNIFGDDSPGGVFSGTKDIAVKSGGLLGMLNTPFEFSFQEKAKFYNFNQEGETISFSFPLINTGSATFDEVKQNWQLIFLLLYQNKPSRLNRTIVEPPVIYEAIIPGQKFIPYAYITNLQVSFKGARRALSFGLPTELQSLYATTGTDEYFESISHTTRTIDAIIPDAYYITITLKSLLSETKNFMAYAHNLAPERNLVEVTTSADKAATAGTTYGIGDFESRQFNSNILDPFGNSQNTATTELLNTVGERLIG